MPTDPLPTQLTPAGKPQSDVAPAPRTEVGLVFALGAEAGGLVDILQGVTTLQGARFIEHLGSLAGRRVAIVESGAGRAAAAQATDDLIALHQPAWIVSAGFAGGLQPALAKRHILMAHAIADESGRQLGVDFQISPEALAAFPEVHVGKLVTVDRLVLDPADKRALGERTGAAACDMESFAVAEVCQRTKTRFLSVRIVSDSVDEALPPEVDAILQQKTFTGQLGAAAKAIWNRWSSAGDLWQLQEDAVLASDKLAKFLRGVIPQLVPPTDSV